MDAKTAHLILTEYNKWRRGVEPYEKGGEKFPYEPKELGEAIRFAIDALGRFDKTLEFLHGARDELLEHGVRDYELEAFTKELEKAE